MTAVETYNQKHETIKEKMASVSLPTDGTATQVCWSIGAALDISGTTVKNYAEGEIKDGYLAEAIFAEFKRLKMTNK